MTTPEQLDCFIAVAAETGHIYVAPDVHLALVKLAVDGGVDLHGITVEVSSALPPGTALAAAPPIHCWKFSE